jgi:Ras family protein
MIVGNKCDMQGQARRISEEQGKKLAQSLKGGFVETSARENINVAKAFEMMIAEIERSAEPEKPAGGGKCLVM